MLWYIHKQLPRFSFSALEYGQKHGTPAAMQMKVETCIENRIWATRMTKHVMEMNKHLQSRLLDLMQCRLLWPTEIDTPTSRKRKMLKIESPLLQGEEEPQSSTKFHDE